MLQIFFLPFYLFPPVNSLALIIMFVLFAERPPRLIGLTAHEAEEEKILVFSSSIPFIITFPFSPLRMLMKYFEAFIGYLPDAIGPFLLGISPLTGTAFLNLITLLR